MIESARVAAKRRGKPSRAYKVKINREAGTMRVGRMDVQVSDVLDALHIGGIIDVETFQRLRAKSGR